MLDGRIYINIKDKKLNQQKRLMIIPIFIFYCQILIKNNHYLKNKAESVIQPDSTAKTGQIPKYC